MRGREQSCSDAAAKPASTHARAEDVTLEIFRNARNLPAIVFAIEFVGQQIKLGLQCVQAFDWPRLSRLELNFLPLGIQAHRFNRPSALLQTLPCAVRIGLVREKEVMVKLGGVAQRFVQLFVGLRAFWAGSKER